MPRVIIHPYNRFSRSAGLLRRAFKGQGVRARMSWKVVNPQELIVNWGDSDAKFLETYSHVLNRPHVVRLMTNKLRFFEHCKDGVPDWTTDPEKAKRWKNVYVRSRLEDTGGEGIVVWRGDGEIPVARLYTKRVFSIAEYRIHVGKGKDGKFSVLDTQRKIFQKSEEHREPSSWAVRSHENGFVFVRNQPPSQPVQQAVLDFTRNKFPDLDFAAFDVLVGKDGRVYVLEGNTAPGLEGQTIQTYCKFITGRLI